MPKAILINGPSSAGKTTLAKSLQETLEEPFLLTGIDLLIRQMLPKKHFLQNMYEKNSDFYWQKEIDPTGSEVQRLYMGERAIRAWKGLVEATSGLLKAGNNVIIDEVSFMGSWQIDDWKQALRPYKLLSVGLYCPLDVLEKRERAREDRMPNSSRGQYFIVHEGNTYDLMVNTHTNGKDEVLSIVQEAVLSIDALQSLM